MVQNNLVNYVSPIYILKISTVITLTSVMRIRKVLEYNKYLFMGTIILGYLQYLNIFIVGETLMSCLILPICT